jgi:hypothetical protein
MAGISYVFTIGRVAEMLGEDEEWLDELLPWNWRTSSAQASQAA